MIAANHQPQFLPYLGFFHKVAHSDVLVLLDDVLFMDRHFQHRNLIKMQTGTQMLTVPVVKHRGQLIRDVALAPIPWRRKVWAAIETNYRPAPYFAALAPGLRAILRDGTHERLVDLDVDLLRWAFEALQITTAIRIASELGLPPSEGPNAHHIAICRAVGAETYLSGPGGKEYMDVTEFERAGIAIRWQDYRGREYAQLFPRHGFIPNLAVVDALFNLGPEARSLLA
ncbi:MAG: WbqC family protein [Deltaproteobacteria bacterium]|nr:WbqC family protein [Deltaproteobacteria bacterium]